MRGRWTSFDTPTTNAEFLTIPQPDRRALFYAMERYAEGDDVGFEVKDYGDGLLMIKKRGPAGRCLFFSHDSEEKLLVALLAYKKESDEAPKNLLESARERRGRYLESQRRS